MDHHRRESEEEGQPFLHPYHSRLEIRLQKMSHFLGWRAVIWTWIGFTVMLLLSTAYLAQKLHRRATMTAASLPQYSGLSSELGAATTAIDYHDIIFTSTIDEDENGQMFLNLAKNEPEYVGSPGPHIDAAWANLTKATEIWVDGDEALSVANRTIYSENGWLVSLDVYHSLHCVNLARKGLDWNYYYGDGPGQEHVTNITKDHIYHCLEHLRQVVMCHGDLTPMRFQYTARSAMPIWDEPHTCRRWDRIRTWAEARRRILGQPLRGADHRHG